MKKIPVIFLLLVALYTNAQSFRKKQLDISCGFGLKSTFIKPSAAQNLSINLAVEYGILNSISIGAYLVDASSSIGYQEKDVTVINNAPSTTYYVQEVKWKFLIAGVRGAYHFNKIVKNSKIDLYAGAMIGNNFAKRALPAGNFPVNTNVPADPNYAGFIYSVFAGCRYRFNEQAGVFAEVGYGVTYISLGFNYRIILSKKDKTKTI